LLVPTPVAAIIAKSLPLDVKDVYPLVAPKKASCFKFKVPPPDVGANVNDVALNVFAPVIVSVPAK
jgi:hypothetical protein